GFLVALACAAPILRPDWHFLARVAIALAVVGAFAFPSYFFFISFRVHENNEAAKWYLQLVEYGGEFFTFFLPMPILGVVIYRMVKPDPMGELEGNWRTKAAFLIVLCIVYVLYLSIGPWRMFRYGTLLMPMTSILLGVGVCVATTGPWTRGIVIALLLLT